MDKVNNVTACLKKLYREQEKRPTVEDVLFGHRTLSYTWYRLRLFGASKGIGVFLHFVELFLFFNKLRQDQFLELALLRLIIGLFEAFWWGELEGLRTGVRRDLELFRLTRCQRRVNAWYSFAVITATAILAVAIAILIGGEALYMGSDRQFTVLYLFCLLFRLAASILSRTVHSAVYGFSRVYRPLWSIIAGEVSWLLTLILLWPIYNLTAIIYATLVSATVSAVLTIYFAAPLYERLHLSFEQQDSHFRGQRVNLNMHLTLPVASIKSLKNCGKLGPRFSYFLSGLASVSMRVGTLLIMSFFNMDRGGFIALFWTVFFFVTIPLLDISIAWANLFYFDLKKYGSSLFGFAKPKMGRYLNFISYELGIVTWIISIGIGYFFLREDMVALLLGSAFFFILRSRLAAAQMRAFCQEHYFTLIFSTVAVGLAMWALNSSELLFLSRDLAFGGILLGAILILEFSMRFWPKAIKWHHEFAYADWLKHFKDYLAASKSGEAYVTIIDFDKNYKYTELSIQQLAESLKAHEFLTMVTKTKALYFNTLQKAEVPWSRARLYLLTGGGVRTSYQKKVTKADLENIVSLPWLKKLPLAIATPEKFSAYLKEHYPKTLRINLRAKKAPFVMDLVSQERHIVLRAAYRFSFFKKPVQCGRYLVLAFSKSDGMEELLLLPAGGHNSDYLVNHLIALESYTILSRC